MKKCVLILASLFCCFFATAQFYNGLQQDFGQNRIQYDEKFWFYFRNDKFDVYFDKNGRSLAEYVFTHADSMYSDVHQFLEYEYSRRIIFVVYNTLGDFRQSNIGYSSADDESNIGGTTQTIDNKICLYFDGDHNHLSQQIHSGIAEVMLSEFLFGIGTYRRILSNASLATYPEWFFDGLIGYLSGNLTYEQQESVANHIAKHSSIKEADLYGDNAKLFGQALWSFIATKYGEKAISNVLYMSKLSENVETSVQYVTDKSLELILTEMTDFYRKTSSDENVAQTSIHLPRRLTRRTITNIALNDDASKLLLTTNKQGKTGVWIYDRQNEKTINIHRYGSALPQIVDYNYPLVAWHPSRNAVAIFYEKSGKIWLAVYNVDTKESLTREFHHFDQILDFSFSKDGNCIVFSGIRGGQTDIYTYNVQTFENEQLTNDNADDRFPQFTNEGVIYTSNRADSDFSKTTVATKKNYSLFLLKKDSLRDLQQNALDIQQPQEISANKFLYLISNQGKTKFAYTSVDSSIRSIDTAIHYAYTQTHFLANDTSTNVKLFSVADSVLAQLQTQNGRSIITIQNFEDETFSPQNFSTDSPKVDSVSTYERETANLYKHNFYINKLVNQIDFSFANTGYQAFTGSEYDYSQQVNVLLKLGIIDLFEDYRLTGAYRFTGSSGSNEYLISVENLSKRLDRQYVFHRQSTLTYDYNASYDYVRVQDNNFICRLTYPFTQTQSISCNPNIRYVRNATLATDLSSLEEPTTSELWTGLSCNYIFDNTRKIDLNIYNGTRAKVFAEAFGQLGTSDSYLCVFGFDFRHYQKIHKNCIIATRFAYSSSFGTSPLLYYLGAVDNWMNWFSNNETYNSNIEYDHSVDWAYQAIGTNMRGFSQNIRNGNSFAVANVEIRCPIIQYIFAKPFKSDILNHFQIIGFADFGGAWSGLYPNQKENAYNYTIIDESPIYVKIDEMRQPFVCGYGYGFRTRIFGYFVRLDFSWGNDEGTIQHLNHFSIGMDF